MNNELIKENYKYFEEHYKEIVEKHLNKYVIIKDKKIVGSYDTLEEAAKRAAEKYELGTFIIQKCDKNIEDSTQIFHSRVVV